jgi:hypothetical protein
VALPRVLVDAEQEGSPATSGSYTRPIQGSCQCDGIRFEVAEPFLSLAFCHCTTCKKISSGVGTANGRARTDEITVLEGRELIETCQRQQGSAKSFCPVCGSNLFGGGWPNSEEASVRLTAIDSSLEQRPQVHNFVHSVAAWETLPDDGLPVAAWRTLSMSVPPPRRR